MMEETVKITHGDGGDSMNQLVRQLFNKYFENNYYDGLDAAVISPCEYSLAITTDSFVVKPIFFHGGNIGKLSICETINNLVVSGAEPLYITVAFILEEGFPMNKLQEIVEAMAEESRNNGIKIITGDTKVVERGKADGIFINTTGVGKVLANYHVKPIEIGDSIIVSGTIGEHGTTIAVDRYDLQVKGELQSDCQSLKPILAVLEEEYEYVKVMSDPSRGGISRTLYEFCDLCGYGIQLFEDQIPIQQEVHSINRLLYLDPCYMACAGRMVLVVKDTHANTILEKIQSLDQGSKAKIIGRFVGHPRKIVFLEDKFHSKSILPTYETNLLPRTF